MPEFLKNMTVYVQSLERKSDGDAVVVVEVRGGSNKVRVPGIGTVRSAPNVVANLRARAKAMLVAGVLPSTVRTIKDVSLGDVKRFTTIEDEVDKPGGKLLVNKVYTIRVNT